MRARTRLTADEWRRRLDAEIERQLTKDKAIAVRAGRPVVLDQRRLVSVLNRFGGPERYCGKITPGTAPWDRITRPPAHQRLSHLFQIQSFETALVQ